jgi:hypothetical protein
MVPEAIDGEVHTDRKRRARSTDVATDAQASGAGERTLASGPRKQKKQQVQAVLDLGKAAAARKKRNARKEAADNDAAARVPQAMNDDEAAAAQEAQVQAMLLDIDQVMGEAEAKLPVTAAERDAAEKQLRPTRRASRSRRGSAAVRSCSTQLMACTAW